MARVNPGALRDALLNMLEAGTERAGAEAASTEGNIGLGAAGRATTPRLGTVDPLTPMPEMRPRQRALEEAAEGEGLGRMPELRGLLDRGLDDPGALRPRARLDAAPGDMGPMDAAPDLLGPEERKRFTMIKSKLAQSIAERAPQMPDGLVDDIMGAPDPRTLAQVLAQSGIDDEAVEILLS